MRVTANLVLEAAELSAARVSVIVGAKKIFPFVLSNERTAYQILTVVSRGRAKGTLWSMSKKNAKSMANASSREFMG